MDALRDVLEAPDLVVFRFILLGFVGIYFLTFFLSRLWVFLRNQMGRTRPPIEAIVGIATLVAFLLQLILPIYAILNLAMTQGYTSLWYFLPYVIVSFVCVLFLLALYQKLKRIFSWHSVN